MSGTSDRNPFVGPRPIQQGESLHGRRTEVRELYDRLQARRIVVLHSPSGAGKSSLVQAGLIPRLKDAKFDVWRPIRVNLDPRGLEGVAPGINRYVLSAMVSLEEELPAEHRRSPAQLASLDLVTYLESRPRRKGCGDHPVVLIFDQFEEVLTVAPRAVTDKRDFFTAVGAALNSGNYWALLIVREDYLAAFAPYRDRIPTQMSNTFRLDLLGLAGAREAAEQLALTGGRSFPAVDQLIRDLSTIQVQQPDGSFVAEEGLHVEPVHLQVVCRRLWEAMPEDDLSIDEQDIAQYAGVSTALAGYYAQAVQKIARGDPTVERSVREWVGGKLIVGGIRSQVRQETGHSAGLDNALIDPLLGSYLVRTEQRAGANWFELSHDRLVEPVQLDNQRWEQEHLHPLQVQAKLWESGRRAQGLLLSAEALAGAAAWAGQNAALLTAGEQEFLEQSRKLRAEEAERQRRERAARRWLRAIAAIAGLAAVLMGVVGNWAMGQRDAALHAEQRAKDNADEARRSEQRARTASMMAGAREFLARGQLGLASMVLAAVKDPENARGWTQLVTDILVGEIPVSTLRHENAVHSAAWSPDGRRIVTASRDMTARVWNADGTGDAIILAGHGGAVNSAAWSPDGQRIATASEDKTMRVWHASGTGDAIVLTGHEWPVLSAVWSPDGERVVTASSDGTVRVWHADGAGERVVLKAHGGMLTRAAWSPDGQRIVTTSVETAQVWNADGTGDPIILKGHESAVSFAAWSPDGKRIVTVSTDYTARVWSADGTGDPLVLKGHAHFVDSAAWSPDGKRIVTVSFDETARVWNADGTGDPLVLEGHENNVLAAVWSPDGKRIATASRDKTARVWNADGRGDPLVLKGHEGTVVGALWSPDGQRIVTASEDATARTWDIGDAANSAINDHGGGATFAAWSPDTQRVLTISDDGTAWVWNTDGTGDPIVLKRHEGGVDSAWSPDGKRIVLTYDDATAQVWNADGTGDPVVLTGHTSGVVSAAWSPDGERIVTASSDTTARVWRADGAGTPLILEGRDGYVFSAVWSPDGKRIVTTSNVTTRVWSADGTGDPLVLTDKSAVNTAVWSPDGARIVTTSNDGTARVWHVDGTDAPIILKGHEDRVEFAAWSPDGERIVTASTDMTARVWHADGVGDPLVLKGHGSAVNFAAWKLDGTRIVTSSYDETARVWNADGFSGGHDRNHLAAVTRATSRLWSRRSDRDQVDPRRSQ